MPKERYLPNTDADRVVWLNNFSNGLTTHGPTVGVSAAEIAAEQDDAQFHEWIVTGLEAQKANVNQWVAYKNTLRDGPLGSPLAATPPDVSLPASPGTVSAGIFVRVTALVGRIKKHTAYNTAIGESLGIIGAEQVFDPLALKPVLKLMLDAGRPLVKWSKGLSDGVDISVDRTGSGTFTYLARDTQPDYLDTFALPAAGTAAVWHYKAIHIVGDTPTGQWSDVVSITVRG